MFAVPSGSFYSVGHGVEPTARGPPSLEATRPRCRQDGIQTTADARQGPSPGPRVTDASSPNDGTHPNRTSSATRTDARPSQASGPGCRAASAMADHGVVLSGTSNDKAAALLALHAGPGFVLPNAWDAGSARVLEQVGFPAIATTSAGIAWACGVPDGGAVDRDSMLGHIGADRGCRGRARDRRPRGRVRRDGRGGRPHGGASRRARRGGRQPRGRRRVGGCTTSRRPSTGCPPPGPRHRRARSC